MISVKILRRVFFLVALFLVSDFASTEVVLMHKVELGGVKEAGDLSAVQVVGDFVVIVSDEGKELQLLTKKNEKRYQAKSSIDLAPASSEEIDLEALAFDGETLYALGSHSLARNKVRDDVSRSENRSRLATVRSEEARDRLFRVEIDPANGKPRAEAESESLRPLLEKHPILKLFAQVPAKENGLDFEGLAVADGRLYLGLRGPVLRGNYVPILSFAYEKVGDCSVDFNGQPKDCHLLYVNLEGNGIRSLHRVTGGFLIVAGPSSSRKAPFELYFWNGLDCVLDDGAQPCELELLGQIPVPKKSKAEGLAVMSETDEAWEILVVFDGDSKGRHFRVSRP